MSLPTSNSSTTLELTDGRAEKLEFTQVKPTKFTVSDSEFSLKSGVNIDIEIQGVHLEATSKELWPGQKVIVKGGIEAGEAPMKASAKIPKGKNIKDGVDGESWLYWTVETPDGVMKNQKPIHMEGKLYNLPPTGTVFTSPELVSLYDLEGNHKGTIYNCAQAN